MPKDQLFFQICFVNKFLRNLVFKQCDPYMLKQVGIMVNIECRRYQTFPTSTMFRSVPPLSASEFDRFLHIVLIYLLTVSLIGNLIVYKLDTLAL